MIFTLHRTHALCNAGRPHTRGNILFLLLIGVVVFAALSAVIMQGGTGVSNLTRERTQIAVDRTFGFASNLKAAVSGLIQTRNISETALRFAHPRLNPAYGDVTTNTRNQIFSIEGGGVDMVDVPQNVTTVAGQQWEFYGFSSAQNVGDNETPDLMLVLPNVTEPFCQALNAKIGFAANAIPPIDTGDCVHDTTKRFIDDADADDEAEFAPSGPATRVEGTFPSTPAHSGCVSCGGGFHFYYVLLER